MIPNILFAVRSLLDTEQISPQWSEELFNWVVMANSESITEYIQLG